MRVIKLAIISFIVFFLLITAFSLLIPSNVRISRAIQIDAPRSVVLNQLNDPINWKNWFPSDDSIQYLFVEGKVKGILLNSNRGLLINSITDSLVTATETGKSHRQMMTGWSLTGNSRVTVQWWTDFKLRWYPWEKFSSLLLDARYGPRLEKGLAQLKYFTENK